MRKKLTTDQVQDVLHKVAAYLEDAKIQWDIQNPEKKAWFSFNKGNVMKATIFLLGITDDLIQFVESFIPDGADKKAAVMLVTAKLFDYIATKSFPAFISPFVPMIKEIVISIIISNLIEFIVSKYKAGYWQMEAKNVK